MSYYERFELKTTPELKRIVLAAFPSYKKRQATLAAFREGGQRINSYWDGGTRDEYAIVELSTGRRKPLPTSTHPYFDIAGRGLANGESPDGYVSSDHVGNVTLLALPQGFALVAAGTFCGKPATAKVYLNSADMPRLLPPAPAVQHICQIPGNTRECPACRP
jgi:hypothetical protein